MATTNKQTMRGAKAGASRRSERFDSFIAYSGAERMDSHSTTTGVRCIRAICGLVIQLLPLITKKTTKVSASLSEFKKKPTVRVSRSITEIYQLKTMKRAAGSPQSYEGSEVGKNNTCQKRKKFRPYKIQGVVGRHKDKLNEKKRKR